jgi:hypothetical protein
MRLAAFVTVADQPGLPEKAEMFRDRRLRDPGLSRQSPDRLLAFATQPFEQCSPGRIGKRFEKHILSIRHLETHNHTAMYYP